MRSRHRSGVSCSVGQSWGSRRFISQQSWGHLGATSGESRGDLGWISAEVAEAEVALVPGGGLSRVVGVKEFGW